MVEDQKFKASLGYMHETLPQNTHMHMHVHPHKTAAEGDKEEEESWGCRCHSLDQAVWCTHIMPISRVHVSFDK